jgi:hypothetical protein
MLLLNKGQIDKTKKPPRDAGRRNQAGEATLSHTYYLAAFRSLSTQRYYISIQYIRARMKPHPLNAQFLYTVSHFAAISREESRPTPGLADDYQGHQIGINLRKPINICRGESG